MLTNSYWNHNGKFEAAAKQLRTLIPIEGPVTLSRSTNKALEKFRKACNCYYDLYNNGLCNRRAEFRRVFGINSNNYRVAGQDKYLYSAVELVMDEIVQAAAIEQFAFETNLQEVAQ